MELKSSGTQSFIIFLLYSWSIFLIKFGNHFVTQHLWIKSGSTYTDGGMLWWVPPTPVTLMLRVEKSKSSHVQQAPETTQLRSTCILGTNNSPYTRTVRVFWAYAAATVEFLSSPEKPDMKEGGKKDGGNQKSPMLAD